ncbi:MAG: hypothetical protein L3K15_02925 [Thermoplasmata archaeon]|nr:hypothetical protein [Thermoplasmata archaeon]
MRPSNHPACEWVSLADEAWTVAICGRPARGVVADADGQRHFACADHLSAVKAKCSTGAGHFRPGQLPFRPYPEAVL